MQGVTYDKTSLRNESHLTSDVVLNVGRVSHMRKADFLIVGSGLSGAVFAQQCRERGKTCIVVEKRNHLGGNVFTSKIEGVNVHEYGAHIFHTKNEKVWKYINRFARFNHYINSPIAVYQGKMYNLPFNMNTFYQLWQVKTPQEAKLKIMEQRQAIDHQPKNLEEQAISLVGRDVYDVLIKGYTEKQWGRSCRELPAEIIRRLPVRFTFDNNYFNDPYQGIPEGGYTSLIANLLEGIQYHLNVDFLKERETLSKLANNIVFTGPIDAFFDYCYGALEYRSVRFEKEVLDCENYQGVAVVNYTDRCVPYTRIIEHKHFEYGTQPKTVISREYPEEWKKGVEPYYPINDSKNSELYQKYERLAQGFENVYFCGRLATYKYYDMDKVVDGALSLATRVNV